MNNEEELQTLDFIIDEARYLQTELTEATKTLEKKAVEVSKSILTIIGFFVTLNALIFAFSDNITNLECIGAIGLGSVLFFIIALVFAEYSNHIRNYSQVSLDLMLELHKEYKFPLRIQKKHLITAYNISQNKILEMNNSKARWLRVSKISMILGTIMGSIFIFMLLFNLN